MDTRQWHAWTRWLAHRGASRPGLIAALVAAALVAAALCGVAAPQLAAASGDDASTSERSTGTKISDATITTKVKATLVGTENLSSGDIHVKTRSGHVALTGSVPDEDQRMLAVNAVKQVEGVRNVRDQLTIRAK